MAFRVGLRVDAVVRERGADVEEPAMTGRRGSRYGADGGDRRIGASPGVQIHAHRFPMRAFFLFRKVLQDLRDMTV